MIDYDKHATEGWTQSELGTLAECGFKWKLQYDMGLRRKGSFSWALVFGDAFHRTLEDAYANAGVLRGGIAEMRFDDDVMLTADNQEEKEYYEMLLEVMVEVYLEHYALDFKTFRLEPNGIERVAVAEIVYRDIPIKLTGKIDLHGTFGFSSIKMIGDHKTCGQLSMVNVLGWDFRFQFMFYVWMLQQIVGKHECGGFMVNAVKKTQLRQKKDESLRSFMSRVRSDMRTRPEEYFYRKHLPLTRGSMENFEENVLKPKLEKIAMLQNPNTPQEYVAATILDRNTDACFKYGTNMPCQFLPICQNGLERELSNYEQRKHKHSELAE